MPEPRRYVLTGAPGAGKTTLLEALHHRGHVTVREAATDQRSVFLIGPLGFIHHAAARRISYADSLAFARVHEQVYEAYGHHLVHVPAGPVSQRVALIERTLARL